MLTVVVFQFFWGISSCLSSSRSQPMNFSLAFGTMQNPVGLDTWDQRSIWTSKDAKSMTSAHHFQYGDPPQCFSSSSTGSTGSSPYPCNLQGTQSTAIERRQSHNYGHSLETIVENRQIIEDLDPSQGDGLVQGIGSYLCILRGSEVGGQIFVRDVGIFRCNFQGAQRITSAIVSGIGYYQCNFQKPGTEQTLVQGVGWYVCLFGGVLRIRGVPENLGLFKLKHLDAFIEVIGSVTGSFVTSPLVEGRVQLLGLYQFGPEGTNLNYGFLQVLEGFTIKVQDSTTALQSSRKSSSKLSSLLKNEEKTALTTVNQLGTAHYSFKGTDFEQGRPQFNHIIGSHIDRHWGAHIFHLFISRYDYLGQYHVFGQNEDIVQVWGYYDYDFAYNEAKRSSASLARKKDEDSSVSKIWPFDLNQFRLMIISEFDLESDIVDFIQLIAQLGWTFKIPNEGVGTLSFIGVYQTNTERSVKGQITDLFVLIFQLLYILPNSDKPGESGFFQVYGIYNWYIELVQERAGWLQAVVEYSRVWDGGTPGNDLWWNPEGTILNLQVWGAYEVNYPNLQFTNGFYEIILTYSVDLGHFLGPLDPFGVTERSSSSTTRNDNDGKGQKNVEAGVISLTLIYRCYVFGTAMKQKFVCYLQGNILYEVGVKNSLEKEQDGRLEGQVVRLMWQFFQEVRNDNVETEEDKKKEAEMMMMTMMKPQMEQ